LRSRGPRAPASRTPGSLLAKGARKGSVDTRRKIVDRRQALEAARQVRAAGKGVKLVMGSFDPLVADHARRLREIAAPDGVVFAAICQSERPILPARARAELVAALGMVDYVILPDETACGDSAELLQPEELYREQAADERRTRDLILHVHQRHS
jgi:bifunctional ADP-heptose synthase (sugar kinase/adenylyltransferase)